MEVIVKRLILAVVATLALTAAPAMATEVAAFGSGWNTKDADQAMGGGFRLDFARYLELRASYFSDLTKDTSPESRDFEIKALPLEAGVNFKLTHDQPFTPYVGGGIGYYMLDTSVGQIDDETGWYGVVGANFKRGSGLGFNIEGIYRNMDATVHGDDLNNISGRVPVDFGGLGVNAGVVWTF
jgi:opacity protein-like surface antigen